MNTRFVRAVLLLVNASHPIFSGAVSRRPRAALVGLSGYGNVHLTELLHLHDAGRLEFTACVVIDAKSHRATVQSLTDRGCRIYEDFDAMISIHDGCLELCCLPTPIPCHAPMTLTALAAGANVLVEKPLVATLADAAMLAHAERRSRRFVAVGFQDIYQPENQSLKNAVLEGELGRLREIRILAVRPRPLSYYRRNDWAGRITHRGAPVYDSPVNNAFAHFANLALFFAGAASERSARTHHVQADLFRAQPIENFDTAVVYARTDADVAIKFYATHSCRTELPLQLVLVGEKGAVEWSNGHVARIVTETQTREFALPSPELARRRMFENILARLDARDAPICDLACATEHVRLVNLIQTGAAIRNVANRHRREIALAADDDRQFAITGIEEDLHSAFASGTTFSEMAPAWSRE